MRFRVGLRVSVVARVRVCVRVGVGVTLQRLQKSDSNAKF